MICDHQGRPVVGMPSPAQVAHSSARAKKAFNGHGAQRHHDLRLNNVDLFNKIWAAGLHFEGSWRPISKRTARHIGPAFKDVRDVNVRAREPHCLNNSGEQLTCTTDKRLSLRVLIRPGRFADKHQVGGGVADSKNGLRSRAGEVRASRANTDAFAERFEHVDLTGGFCSALPKPIDRGA